MSSENGSFIQASYPSPRQSYILLSRGHNAKRICVTTAFENFEQRNHPSIEIFLDKFLFEVFKRLPSGKEKSTCGCVSKRWLMILSNIRKDEIVESNRYLATSLVGRKATNVRLVAIAIGTANHRGLAKLSIQGNNLSCDVIDVGLKAIARGCPTLRELSLWNVSFVGDEGLSEIADGCHLLEKLDLFQCPRITDKSLWDIVRNCPNLTSLSINDCSYIGNESLKAVGQHCPNLKLVVLKRCLLIEDQGIVGLFHSSGHVLKKVKLKTLNISDNFLDIISHYGTALTNLALGGLEEIKEKGFWVYETGHHLQKLKAVSINACNRVNDLGLQVICKGCPNLKMFYIRKSNVLSDNGLIACVKASVSLQSIQLKECHRITQAGFLGILLNHGKKLKVISLVNCFGVEDLNVPFPLVAPCCNSLVSLTIRNCPGVGNTTIDVVGRLCHKLTHIELSGLLDLTDNGIFPIVQRCTTNNLVAVNLKGCVNITDKTVSTIVDQNGASLKSLIVDRCRHVTDATLVKISKSCFLLNELDVSKCGITDYGIRTLAYATQLHFRILSLSDCPLLSDKSISTIVELHWASLKTLIVDSCRHVTDATLVKISNYCWLLNELDVSNCGISDHGITTLASAINIHLQIPSLSGCPLVLDNSLPFLLDLVQDLEILKIHHCPGIISTPVDALVEKHPGCDITIKHQNYGLQQSNISS